MMTLPVITRNSDNSITIEKEVDLFDATGNKVHTYKEIRAYNPALKSDWITAFADEDLKDSAALWWITQSGLKEPEE